MSRTTRNLMTLLSLFVLAAVVSAWPSAREASAQPGNSGGPVRVTVVNPVPLPVIVAGSPFQIVLCSSAAFGSSDLPDCSGNKSAVTLPPDRRAVIELVSTGCTYRNADFLRVSLSTELDDVRAEYPLHLESSDLDSGRLEGALQGRIYADPGSTIGLTASSSAPGTVTSGSVECTIAISGLLIAK